MEGTGKMTMQMRDTFSYKGVQAEAIAISQKFSFTPAKSLGVTVGSWSTANYRGFWCDYSIDDILVIHNLYLFSEDHAYPILNEKKAEEIPIYRHLLDDIKRNPRHKTKQYQDGFPMQYSDIDYYSDYTGRVVLGIDPVQNKPEQERYRSVIELVLDSGIVMETTDITDLWKAAKGRSDDSSTSYWWEHKENSYSYLINYGLMGL